MNLKNIFISVFLITKLCADNNMRVDLKIAYIKAREGLLTKGSISDQERLDVLFSLIPMYSEKDFLKIRILCETILATPNINYRHAPFYLGLIYMFGKGVELNISTAKKYFQMAIEQKDYFNKSFYDEKAKMCIAMLDNLSVRLGEIMQTGNLNLIPLSGDKLSFLVA